MGLLLLVRHGQASFGADDYDRLSETGHEQARVLGGWLAEHDVAPVSVVHGGLRRHRETWEGMVAGAGWSNPAAVDPDWDEFDFHAVLGHHSSLTGAVVDPEVDRRAFQAAFEAATGHWIDHDPDGAGEAPYPEPFADFVERSRRALDAARQLAGPALVVTSGGVIATVAASLLAADSEDPVAVGRLWDRLNTVVVNTSVTRVLIGRQGARLLSYNEHLHLGRDLLTYR